MGFLFNSGKKNAQIQADATIKSAELTAANDRLMAQASQSAAESMLAQKRAGDSAAALLSVPQGNVDVQLNPGSTPTPIDPSTGRSKKVRTIFNAFSQGMGIKL